MQPIEALREDFAQTLGFIDKDLKGTEAINFAAHALGGSVHVLERA